MCELPKKSKGVKGVLLSETRRANSEGDRGSWGGAASPSPPAREFWARFSSTLRSPVGSIFCSAAEVPRSDSKGGGLCQHPMGTKNYMRKGAIICSRGGSSTPDPPSSHTLSTLCLKKRH